MSRTRFLAAIAVAALSMQLFPKYSDFIKWVAISLGVLYVLGSVLPAYAQQYRVKRQKLAQRAADEEEFQRYTAEMNLIRAKYERDGAADEMATGRDDYAGELAALHLRHRDMLERKFGPG